MRHLCYRKLGLIGGLSWHSTLEYYMYLNQTINDHFGNNTNPPLVLVNLDQYCMHQLQKSDQWDAIARMLIEACDQLYKAEHLPQCFVPIHLIKCITMCNLHSMIPHTAHWEMQ